MREPVIPQDWRRGWLCIYGAEPKPAPLSPAILAALARVDEAGRRVTETGAT